MLADDALSATPEGFSLRIRSHWYRSLPLSSIGTLAVKLDGAVVPPENISFEVNGARHPHSALPSLHDEWWFILDAAAVRVQWPDRPAPGSSHEVAVELGLLLPYILVGPRAEPLLSLSRVAKTLRCQSQ